MLSFDIKWYFKSYEHIVTAFQMLGITCFVSELSLCCDVCIIET